MKLSVRVSTMNRHISAAQIRSSRRAQAAQSNIAREAVHPVDRHVGHQIRIRRMQSNISLGDLGTGIGVSLQQVQKYESGKNRVSASMLYELASRLKVPVSKFYEGLPDPETSQDQQLTTEIDERLAYISTAEGRRLIEDVLLLSPRVRSRVVALVSSIVDEEMEEQTDVDR
jgi:transcriptional regulator with XRE-family HTH domain